MGAVHRGLSGRVAAVSLAVFAILAGAATYAWLAGFAPVAFNTRGWITGLLVADLVIAVTLVALLAVRLTQLCWIAGAAPPARACTCAWCWSAACSPSRPP